MIIIAMIETILFSFACQQWPFFLPSVTRLHKYKHKFSIEGHMYTHQTALCQVTLSYKDPRN